MRVQAASRVPWGTPGRVIGWRVVPEVGEKRRHAQAGGRRIVVCEFRYGQEIYLIGHFVVDEGSQVSFKSLIGSLCLAVRLRVERGAHPRVDTGQLEEIFPELGDESGVLVRDNVQWNPV